jgi:hypothetical protein
LGEGGRGGGKGGKGVYSKIYFLEVEPIKKALCIEIFIFKKELWDAT